jgi:hypothetical protein
MKNKTKGTGLIEVLMSLLLISLILFGLEAGEIYSLREAKILWFVTTARNQISNITERLSTLQMNEGITELVDTWNAENKIVLPSGFGTLTGSWPHFNVTIYWGTKSHHCAKQITGTAGCLKEKIQLG